MKKGFTLIELLVVIAIIAILAAILFPVFAQAREKARQTTCLSNCKQIGTALQLYVDDYDETVPWCADINGTWGLYLAEYNGYPCQKYITVPSWGTPGYFVTWMDEIYPYVKNMKIFECPSGIKNTAGYGYNAQLTGTNNDHVDKTAGTPISLAAITNTSEIVFCCDGAEYNGGGGAADNRQAGCMYPELIGALPESWVIRHNQGMNFTFCDGHAKYFKKNQGPCMTSGWGYNQQYWDPYWPR